MLRTASARVSVSDSSLHSRPPSPAGNSVQNDRVFSELSHEPLTRKLDAAAAQAASIERLELDEKTFRYQLNDDAMATEKTAEGIRKFAADIVKLEQFIAGKL